MDIMDKYAAIAARHDQLLEVGADPFAVCMQEIRSPTEAVIEGKPVILFGTNNYLGLTFDDDCIEASMRGEINDILGRPEVVWQGMQANSVFRYAVILQNGGQIGKDLSGVGRVFLEKLVEFAPGGNLALGFLEQKIRYSRLNVEQVETNFRVGGKLPASVLDRKFGMM